MSKKLKLSPWHKGTNRPFIVGVYQVVCEDKKCDICKREEFYSYYDGFDFQGYWESIEEANHKRSEWACNVGKWRGILK